MPLLIENPEKDITLAVESAHRNVKRLMAEMPGELEGADERLPRTIANSGLDTLGQLQELHTLSVGLFEAMRPFTACKQQCSFCCHYAVSVYPIEAELIAKSLGLPRPSMPARGRNAHGRACTFFTKDGCCSIYEVRPMACRQHSMLTSTNYWCHPARSLDQRVPMPQLSGVKEAFDDIVSRDGRSQSQDLRDIRDYFEHG